MMPRRATDAATTFPPSEAWAGCVEEVADRSVAGQNPGMEERRLLRAQASARRRRRRIALAAAAALAALAAVAIGLLAASSGPPRATSRRPGPRAPALAPPARPRSDLGRRSVASRTTPRSLAAQVTRELDRLAALGEPVRCGGRRGRDVALTFDDGPGPYSTWALRILRHAHASATFFLVGRLIADWRQVPAEETSLAALGDHTWTHVLLTGLGAGALRHELAAAKTAIDAAAHVSVRLFRPPYGGYDARVLALARSLGLVTVLWSIDTRDSEGAPWNQIIANVEQNVRPGSIILMHENRGQTIEALKFGILPYLRRRGLHPVTVPELLAVDPPSKKQLAAGLAGCS
jgi:peptidoglycan/xylan/chitin deacetylase (PgdA/CDA1 family)